MRTLDFATVCIIYNVYEEKKVLSIYLQCTNIKIISKKIKNVRADNVEVENILNMLKLNEHKGMQGSL